MAKRRSISNEIRLSQSFARLTLRQRDLWHGLIATADDQGRLPGLPAAVRALVWPYDDILLSEVSKDIEAIAEQGNIHIYEVGGDTFIQIINWWNYQKPQWATFSKYPAPPGWLDRVRITGPKKTVVKENWHTPGGFYLATDEVNDKDKVNVKVKAGTPALDKGGNKGGNKPLSTGGDFPFLDVDTSDLGEEDRLYRQLINTFFTLAKLPMDDDLRPRDNEAVLQWVGSECIREDIANAIQYNTDNDLPIVSPASVHKGVMIERGKRLRKPEKQSTYDKLKAELGIHD